METITNIKYNINNNSNRHYKIIILIIASENEPYSTFVKYWEKYMNLFPEVRCFFLYSNPEIDYDVIVNENSIILVTIAKLCGRQPEAISVMGISISASLVPSSS
jgi:hypothetical protein